MKTFRFIVMFTLILISSAFFLIFVSVSDIGPGSIGTYLKMAAITIGSCAFAIMCINSDKVVAKYVCFAVKVYDKTGIRIVKHVDVFSHGKKLLGNNEALYDAIVEAVNNSNELF